MTAQRRLIYLPQITISSSPSCAPMASSGRICSSSTSCRPGPGRQRMLDDYGGDGDRMLERRTRRKKVSISTQDEAKSCLLHYKFDHTMMVAIPSVSLSCPYVLSTFGEVRDLIANQYFCRKITLASVCHIYHRFSFMADLDWSFNLDTQADRRLQVPARRGLNPDLLEGCSDYIN